MTKELKEFVAKRKQLQVLQEEKKRQIEQLTEKESSIKGSLAGLNESMITTEKTKKNMLSAFLTGKCSQQDIDSADDDLLKAGRRLTQAQGMLEETPKVRRELELEVAKLTETIAGCDRDIWQQIFLPLKAEIEQTLGDKLNRAYAAYNLGYHGLDWRTFLPILFDRSPGTDAIQNLQKELALKNGIEI